MYPQSHIVNPLLCVSRGTVTAQAAGAAGPVYTGCHLGPCFTAPDMNP